MNVVKIDLPFSNVQFPCASSVSCELWLSCFDNNVNGWGTSSNHLDGSYCSWRAFWDSIFTVRHNSTLQK